MRASHRDDARNDTATTTRHKADCARVFNRYDMTCDRCVELRMGFGARRGWGDLNRENAARRIAEIRAHRCSPETCGPVCTRFDW